MNRWRLAIDEPGDAAWNMAVDEALLHAVGRGDVPPTLRMYGWSPPAVSLGYFQDAAFEIDLGYCRRRGWPVVRRLTGGRAVLHADELTYSVAAPAHCALFPQDVSGTYRAIARGILAGLHQLGVAAEMVSVREKTADMQGRQRSAACFSAPSWYELTVGGKKVAGSAQRRWPHAFLQHGSILLGVNAEEQCRILQNGNVPVHDLGESMTSLGMALNSPVSWHEAAEALCNGFEEVLGISLEKGELSPGERDEAEALRESRYGTDEWNLTGPRRKRS